MKNYILSILISLLIISCRSGAQVPEDTVIKVMTPTPVPVDCKNEFYPSDAPQFGEESSFNYKALNDNLKMVTITDGNSDKEVEVITEKADGNKCSLCWKIKSKKCERINCQIS